MDYSVHPTAEVSDKAKIGSGTRIWHQAQIREGASVGRECIIGKGTYIDFDVSIGNRCKLQNGVYVYHGAILEDGVFLGPGVMILNDKHPRAVTPEGHLKLDTDWNVSGCTIGRGAGIGGGAIILPGVSVGQWAIVGSGAVVTRKVPDYGLVYGNPARLAGFVCACAQRLIFKAETDNSVVLVCGACHAEITIPLDTYCQLQ